MNESAEPASTNPARNSNGDIAVLRRVSYANETFVTSEEVAAALIAFATTLAEETTAESVQVPVIDDHGQPVVIEVLVGPSSELISKPEPGPAMTLDTRPFIDDLLRRGSQARGNTSTGRALEDNLPDIDQY